MPCGICHILVVHIQPLLCATIPRRSDPTLVVCNSSSSLKSNPSGVQQFLVAQIQPLWCATVPHRSDPTLVVCNSSSSLRSNPCGVQQFLVAQIQPLWCATVPRRSDPTLVVCTVPRCSDPTLVVCNSSSSLRSNPCGWQQFLVAQSRPPEGKHEVIEGQVSGPSSWLIQ